MVCESGALEAIINTFGHERLLYGSDFPVTHARGRAVTLGDSFHWLDAQNADLRGGHAECVACFGFPMSMLGRFFRTNSVPPTP